ncbi:EAL domain-containing response regulator [Photobacterium leiognathi]|uniref:EAL domain-containing response regulator n=1 Tax=Photobacterium leiognathi TaxID=553611 RepID=UPI002738BFF3|nr:EAL domain-containing response regulator [Photobacterium leiognathi]
MRILLIEDHDFQRQVLTTQLARIIDSENDEIQCAINGADALKIMQQYQPHLLLCDLNMPEMDGISFLGHIAKQHYKGSIIITSALKQDILMSVEKMCLNYDLNLLGTLSKPTCLKQLSVLLKQAKECSTLTNQGSTSEIILDDAFIDNAFEQGWFVPYFQPIVSLSTGEWVACEALIRLVHPEYGTVPAYQFIDQIMQHNKEKKLALFILNYVICYRSYFHNRKIAINISSKTLVDPHFINCVLQLKEQYQDLNQWVYFELTESEIFESVGQAIESASRLSMHDFVLSIDDFGTGYSSLKQLETLTFNSLKLDLSFIQAIPTSITAEAIVESCLLLTKRLNLETVAEGVESLSLWQQLQEMNCPLAQGYFISPPLPYNSIDAWYQQWQQKSGNLTLSA